MLKIVLVGSALLSIVIGFSGKANQRPDAVIGMISVGIVTSIVGVLIGGLGEVMVIPIVNLSVWPGPFFGGAAIAMGGVILLVRIHLRNRAK